MNLSKSPLRRAAGLAAGAVLGLAGVVAVATPASAHDGVIGYSTACDTATGEWVVSWTVTGNAPEGVTKFRFNEVGAEVGQPDEAAKVTGYEVGEAFTYPTNEAVKAEQRVAADKSFARLTVKIEFDNGVKDMPRQNTAHFDGTCAKTPEPSPSVSTPAPEPSASTSASPSVPASPSASPSVPASPSASPTPSASETPGLPEDVLGEPVPIIEMTCDTMTVGFKVPEDGIKLDLHYKTSKGEERDLTINPGEAKSEKFSATEGFSIDLTISVTAEGETFTETVNLPFAQSGDCDSGSGGGLPVTGAAAGGIAGGAAALLAVGALLFFMARRRKVNFTA